MIKKLLLVMCIMVALISISIVSVNAETSGDYQYKINNDGLSVTITGYIGSGGDIEIPANIEGKKVTDIGNMAFYWKTNIASVIIPDNVKNISELAFAGCDNLVTVNISKSVENLLPNSFPNGKLENINVDTQNNFYSSENGVLFNKNKSALIIYPDGKLNSFYEIPLTVNKIEKEAFWYCKNLVTINLPLGLKSIDYRAFSFCEKLTEISIPNGVTSIGDYAFDGCVGLTSVLIPESVTNIGDNAFLYCKNLNSIDVSENNVNYSSLDGVLFDKYKIYLYKHPEGKLGSYYEISESVSYIKSYAFYGCDKLTEIKMHENVRDIGNDSFAKCTNLSKISLPDGLWSIGQNAFNLCSSLTQITIPKGVTRIMPNTFSYCKNLISVTMSNSITHIESYAFNQCDSLVELSLPKRIKYIYDGAFYGCDKLTNATFNSNAPWMGFYVFDGASTDFKIKYYEEFSGFSTPTWNGYNTVKLSNVPLTVLFDYELNDDNQTATITGYTGNSENIVIPSNIDDRTVTHIGEWFSSWTSYDRTKIKSITISDGIKYVGDYAFSSCTSLQIINVPNSVIEIGMGAFGGCPWYNNLPNGLAYIGSVAYKYIGDMPENASIILEDRTASIAAYAFSNQTKLVNIDIPNSVTNVEKYAFSGCVGLTSITLPNSLERIEEYAFSNCINLSSIQLSNDFVYIASDVFKNTAFYNNYPDGIVYIGNIAYTYKGDMEDNAIITIKDGTVRINDRAFQRPSEYGLGAGWSIKEVIIPSSVKSIGDSAFYWCPEMKKVTFGGDAPTDFGKYVFDPSGLIEGFAINYYGNAKGFTTPLWNGYYCFEISPIKTSVRKIDNIYEVDVSLSNNISSDKISIALYDNTGKLISIKSYDVNDSTTKTFNIKGTEKLWKVFVWESINNMLPLCLYDSGML